MEYKIESKIRFPEPRNYSFKCFGCGKQMEDYRTHTCKKFITNA